MRNLIKTIILLGALNISYAKTEIFYRDGGNVLYYGNGATEELLGEKVNGVKQGDAIEKYEDGRVFKYKYVDGVRQGKAIIEYPNGEIETVNIEDGMLYGKAEKRIGDIVWDMEYKFNTLDGKEEMSYNDYKEIRNRYFGKLIDLKIKTKNYEVIQESNIFSNKEYYISKDTKIEITRIQLNEEEILENVIMKKDSNTYIQTFINQKAVIMGQHIAKNGKKKYVKNINKNFKEFKQVYIEYEGKDNSQTKEIKGKDYLVKIKDGKLEFVQIKYENENDILFDVDLYYKDSKLTKSITKHKEVKYVESYKDSILDGKSQVIYENNELVVTAYFKDGRLKANSELIYEWKDKSVTKIKVNDMGLMVFPYNAYLNTDEDEKLIGYVPSYTLRESEIRNPIYVYALTKKGEYIIYERLNNYGLRGEYIKVDKVK